MSEEEKEIWRKALRAATVRLGDFIALIVMSFTCMIVSMFRPYGLESWTWWSAGIVLLIMALRTPNERKEESE